MVLGKVRIQNFKSIIDTGWIFLSRKDLITILAGQNESGKTSFLRALKFFQEGSYASFREDDERLETHPRVDLVFYLTEDEYLKLKEKTNKDIADYYKSNGFNFVRGNVQEDDYKNLKYMYPEDIKSIISRFNDGLEEGIEKFEAFSYFNNLRPEIIFYSSFSDNILPGKATYTDIPNNQAIVDFEIVYDVDFQTLVDPNTTDQKRAKVIEEVNKKAGDSLNTYWRQKISGEKSEYKYRIAIIPQPNIQESYINFYIDQGDGMPLKISQKSQGFQWFSGFILRLRAHESVLETKGLILLIDEPGQGLHEVAQQDVKDVIEEISKKSNIQIIYSTHQPILLGKENIDFSRLLLVDRNNKEGSKFKSISQLVTSKGSLDALSPIRTAMGIVTITDPFKKKITVLVEGITEYFYFKTLFNDEYIIIPSAGVDQIPNLFAILYGWGIPSKVIVDDDMQGKKAFGKIKKEFYNGEETAEFKRAVLKISESDGIENLISINEITQILKEFGKKYDKNKSKVDNVKQVGKFIFAKSFFDKYSSNITQLDAETKKNYSGIAIFLNNSEDKVKYAERDISATNSNSRS